MPQKIIILGGTSGIGLQLAKDFVGRGDLVGVTGRNEQYLQELQNMYPNNIHIQAFDVTDTKTSVENLQQLVEKLGGLDLFILSAGIGFDDPDVAFVFSSEQKVINTNVVGRTNAMDRAMQYFMVQGRGHIVGISSIAGIRGIAFSPSYSASKSYTANYLESMRLYVDKKKLPITVLDVQPGFVDTAMIDKTKSFWTVPVTEASRVIMRAIDKKYRHVYVTARRGLVAWAMKHLPYRIYEKIMSKIV